MSRNAIYILVAIVGAGLIIVGVTVFNRPDPEPAVTKVTPEQAATYANSARRTEYNPSKPSTYEWKQPEAAPPNK